MKKQMHLKKGFLILSLLCIPLSFGIANALGETHIFGTSGFTRYSWVMLLFIPISLVSLVLGIDVKHKTISRGHIVACIVCLFFFGIFGSFRFFYQDTFTYTTEPVYAVQDKVTFDMPDDIKASTRDIGYKEIRVKLQSAGERAAFETALQQSEYWTSEMDALIQSSLPFGMAAQIEQFDYFLFYNETTGEYNTYPLYKGDYVCTFIAYNTKTGCLFIADDYKIVEQ